MSADYETTVMTATLSKTYAKGGAWLLWITDDWGDTDEYWAFTSKAHATAYLREASGKRTIRWRQQDPTQQYFTYEWTEQ